MVSWDTLLYIVSYLSKLVCSRYFLKVSWTNGRYFSKILFGKYCNPKSPFCHSYILISKADPAWLTVDLVLACWEPTSQWLHPWRRQSFQQTIDYRYCRPESVVLCNDLVTAWNKTFFTYSLPYIRGGYRLATQRWRSNFYILKHDVYWQMTV